MPTRPSDSELIARSLGEPEAFGGLYDRHAPALFRYLGRRVGAETGEALAHEAFRIAFERRKAFDPQRASALPWLYGIAANLLRKHRRGEARWLRASARMAAGSAAADPGRAAAAVEARALFGRVAEAVDALPEAEREALLLYAWEELSYERSPRCSGSRSAPCARASRAPARGFANSRACAGK